jgi:hypothetical protein
LYCFITLDWVDALGLDIDNKANGHDVVMMEFSADRTKITIMKRPSPPEMSKPVDAKVFEVDSDAAAAMFEGEFTKQSPP